MLSTSPIGLLIAAVFSRSAIFVFREASATSIRHLSNNTALVDLSKKRAYDFAMRHLSTSLVLLLLLLTFNAYACLLPLQTTTQMDCSSTTEAPVRQTCDAFLEIGPHSEFSSSPGVTALHFDFEVPIQLPAIVLSVSQPAQPPCDSDTPIHLSIQTTVLRI